MTFSHMRMWQFTVGLGCWLLLVCLKATAGTVALPPTNSLRAFTVHGVVVELRPAEQTVVIHHDAIPDYMDSMTMPFKVKDATNLSELGAGDQITFRLQVTDSESWVDRIVKTGTAALPPPRGSAGTGAASMIHPSHPLLDYKFTNELGQAVSINDFRGQALAITFFYTRCPLPDYCPRLSKNFQEASAKLKARPEAPTNWHFLSISFDPEFDTPDMLKAYAGTYQADPAHWSFLTGPSDKIGELAHASGISYRYADGTIDHNFRTLIIDANGHLQTVFPTGGNLSEMIVSEILKAAAATNQRVSKM
jgi:protein SCO1/2